VANSRLLSSAFCFVFRLPAILFLCQRVDTDGKVLCINNPINKQS
jgi:hypothetical protein